MELYQRVSKPASTFDREPRVADALYDYARAAYEARTRGLQAQSARDVEWDEGRPGCHVDGCRCPDCSMARFEAEPRAMFPAVQLAAAYALEELMVTHAQALDAWIVRDEIRVDIEIERYREYSFTCSRVEAVTR